MLMLMLMSLTKGMNETLKTAVPTIMLEVEGI
jgi:hypothetical protein